MLHLANFGSRLPGASLVWKGIFALAVLTHLPVAVGSECSVSCADGSSCKIKHKDTFTPPVDLQAKHSTATDLAVKFDTVVDIEGGVLHESHDVAEMARRVLAAAASLGGQDQALDAALVRLRQALALRNGKELQVALAGVQASQATGKHPQLAAAFEKVSCNCNGQPPAMATCNY